VQGEIKISIATVSRAARQVESDREILREIRDRIQRE
jgi:hypothetical protein